MDSIGLYPQHIRNFWTDIEQPCSRGNRIGIINSPTVSGSMKQFSARQFPRKRFSVHSETSQPGYLWTEMSWNPSSLCVLPLERWILYSRGETVIFCVMQPKSQRLDLHLGDEISSMVTFSDIYPTLGSVPFAVGAPGGHLFLRLETFSDSRRLCAINGLLFPHFTGKSV